LLCEGSQRSFSFRRTRKIHCRVWEGKTAAARVP
jgi:hypothetical protein